MYESKMWCGPNDGGIRRGDRADTGDEEARPTQGVTRDGSTDQLGGNATPTADPSSMGGSSGVTGGSAYIQEDTFRKPSRGARMPSDMDELTIHEATDGVLGLTNVGNEPAEDWSADVGPTVTAEEEDSGAGRH